MEDKSDSIPIDKVYRDERVPQEIATCGGINITCISRVPMNFILSNVQIIEIDIKHEI